MLEFMTECKKRGCVVVPQSLVGIGRSRYMVFVPGGHKFLIGFGLKPRAGEILLAVIDRLLESRDKAMRREVLKNVRNNVSKD